MIIIIPPKNKTPPHLHNIRYFPLWCTNVPGVFNTRVEGGVCGFDIGGRGLRMAAAMDYDVSLILISAVHLSKNEHHMGYFQKCGPLLVLDYITAHYM